MQAQLNKMVSIIMLSRNMGRFVQESVRSIQEQTYQDWELLFVDDSSNDDTVHQLMELKDNDPRIKVTKTVYHRGDGNNRNSALRQAKGRWIAFLNCGDLWDPEKLEKQIRLMEGQCCSFSYTKYRIIDEQGRDRGYVMGGPKRVTYQDMMKCCWLGYATVMYDREKVGLQQVKYLEENNDYALWLMISDKHDCVLLDECLVSYRLMKPIPMHLMTSRKLGWRYEVYRKVEDLGVLESAYLSVRNLWYSGVKWLKYAKRNS